MLCDILVVKHILIKMLVSLLLVNVVYLDDLRLNMWRHFTQQQSEFHLFAPNVQLILQK